MHLTVGQGDRISAFAHRPRGRPAADATRLCLVGLLAKLTLYPRRRVRDDVDETPEALIDRYVGQSLAT